MTNHYEQAALDDFYSRVKRSAAALIDRPADALARAGLDRILVDELNRFYSEGHTLFDQYGPIPKQDVEISISYRSGWEWGVHVCRRDFLREDVPDGHPLSATP